MGANSKKKWQKRIRPGSMAFARSSGRRFRNFERLVFLKDISAGPSPPANQSRQLFVILGFLGEWQGSSGERLSDPLNLDCPVNQEQRLLRHVVCHRQSPSCSFSKKRKASDHRWAKQLFPPSSRGHGLSRELGGPWQIAANTSLAINPPQSRWFISPSPSPRSVSVSSFPDFYNSDPIHVSVNTSTTGLDGKPLFTFGLRGSSVTPPFRYGRPFLSSNLPVGRHPT